MKHKREIMEGTLLHHWTPLSQSCLSVSRCLWCGSGSRDDPIYHKHWHLLLHQSPGQCNREKTNLNEADRLNLYRKTLAWSIYFRKCDERREREVWGLHNSLTSTSSPVAFSLIHFTTHVLALWSPLWITPYTLGSWEAWSANQTF